MDLDAAIDDLGHECRERFEAGDAVAAAQVEALLALADAVTDHLGEWRRLTATIELRAPFDGRRAGLLLLESVFDDILEAAPWRVLAAAVAAAESGE
ncbi:MAG TPA: hypothetical protein VGH15_00490 [Caulobacteraceae bacterium]|jgi:hypothetical protein